MSSDTSECWESLKGIINRRVPGVGLGSNIISMCQYLAPIYTEIPFIFSFLIFVHTFSKLCFMYKVMHILLYLLLCILIFVTSWNYGTCKYILIVIVYKYSQFPIRYTVRFVNINMHILGIAYIYNVVTLFWLMINSKHSRMMKHLLWPPIFLKIIIYK